MKGCRFRQFEERWGNRWVFVQTDVEMGVRADSPELDSGLSDKKKEPDQDPTLEATAADAKDYANDLVVAIEAFALPENVRTSLKLQVDIQLIDLNNAREEELAGVVELANTQLGHVETSLKEAIGKEIDVRAFADTPIYGSPLPPNYVAPEGDGVASVVPGEGTISTLDAAVPPDATIHDAAEVSPDGPLEGTLVSGQTISGMIQSLTNGNDAQKIVIASHYELADYNPDNDPNGMKLLVHLFPWKNGVPAGTAKVTIDGIEDPNAVHKPKANDKVTIHPDGRIQVTRLGVSAAVDEEAGDDQDDVPEDQEDATEDPKVGELWEKLTEDGSEMAYLKKAPPETQAQVRGVLGELVKLRGNTIDVKAAWQTVTALAKTVKDKVADIYASIPEAYQKEIDMYAGKDPNVYLARVNLDLDLYKPIGLIKSLSKDKEAFTHGLQGISERVVQMTEDLMQMKDKFVEFTANVLNPLSKGHPLPGMPGWEEYQAEKVATAALVAPDGGGAEGRDSDLVTDNEEVVTGTGGGESPSSSPDGTLPESGADGPHEKTKTTPDARSRTLSALSRQVEEDPTKFRNGVVKFEYVGPNGFSYPVTMSKGIITVDTPGGETATYRLGYPPSRGALEGPGFYLSSTARVSNTGYGGFPPGTAEGGVWYHGTEKAGNRTEPCHNMIGMTPEFLVNTLLPNLIAGNTPPTLEVGLKHRDGGKSEKVLEPRNRNGDFNLHLEHVADAPYGYANPIEVAAGPGEPVHRIYLKQTGDPYNKATYKVRVGEEWADVMAVRHKKKAGKTVLIFKLEAGRRGVVTLPDNPKGGVAETKVFYRGDKDNEFGEYDMWDEDGEGDGDVRLADGAPSDVVTETPDGDEESIPLFPTSDFEARTAALDEREAALANREAEVGGPEGDVDGPEAGLDSGAEVLDPFAKEQFLGIIETSLEQADLPPKYEEYLLDVSEHTINTLSEDMERAADDPGEILRVISTALKEGLVGVDFPDSVEANIVAIANGLNNLGNSLSKLSIAFDNLPQDKQTALMERFLTYAQDISADANFDTYAQGFITEMEDMEGYEEVAAAAKKTLGHSLALKSTVEGLEGTALMAELGVPEGFSITEEATAPDGTVYRLFEKKEGSSRTIRAYANNEFLPTTEIVQQAGSNVALKVTIGGEEAILTFKSDGTKTVRIGSGEVQALA